MARRKRPFYWTRLVVFALIVLSAMVAIYKPQWVNLLATFSVLPLLTLLIWPALLWGRGQHRALAQPLQLPECHPKRSFLSWFLNWWGAFILLWVMWVVHHTAWVQTGPAGITTQIIDMKSVLYDHWARPWYAFGFPWSWYTLLAISYAWCLSQYRLPVPESLATPLFRGRLLIAAKNMIAITANLSTQSILALCVLSVVVLCNRELMQVLPGPDLSNLGIWMLIWGAFLFFALRWVPWRRLMRYTNAKGVGLAFWTAMLMCMLVGTTVLLSSIVYYFLPTQAFFVPIESVFGFKMNAWAPPSLRLETLMWGWWFCWMPLMGSWLTHISQGRPLWQVYLMAVFTPLLMWVTPVPQLAMGFVVLGQSGGHTTNILFASIALLFLLCLFAAQQTTLRLGQGWQALPRPSIFKIQGIGKAIAVWANLNVSLVFLYGMSGWYLIQVQVLTPGALLATAAILLNISLLALSWPKNAIVHATPNTD